MEMLTAKGCFNPRPRVGGDARRCAGSEAALKFQSTPPRGGRHKLRIGCARETMFQSTPPRGGRQERLVMAWEIETVSIHAPAWGAT